MQVAAGKNDIQRIEGASAKHGNQGHHQHGAQHCLHSPIVREPSSSRSAAFRWNWVKNSWRHLTHTNGGFSSTCSADSIRGSWMKPVMRNDKKGGWHA